MQIIFWSLDSLKTCALLHPPLFEISSLLQDLKPPKQNFNGSRGRWILGTYPHRWRSLPVSRLSRQNYHYIHSSEEQESDASFLGLVNYCRSWVPNCSNCDKTLRGGIATGILAQEHGGNYRPVAYLSKTLDAVAKGLSGCLRAVAATALMVQDAERIVLSHPLVVHTSHQVGAIMHNITTQHMTAQRRSGFEVILLATANLTLKPTSTVHGSTVHLHKLLTEGEFEWCSAWENYGKRGALKLQGENQLLIIALWPSLYLQHNCLLSWQLSRLLDMLQETQMRQRETDMQTRLPNGQLRNNDKSISGQSGHGRAYDAFWCRHYHDSCLVYTKVYSKEEFVFL
ncbi:uncharacterized protein LOC127438829 isoform X2 [Myxocyprinus asiaticus]|uniref:uncharacterized protein LOC127438829 isoform X2 n=1 Tax=Myxocyprinus asiaticus TaxID=70543 RepID=UPI0022234DF5|nr:uncharacterized protein LOC127438829 isoform X2 [Myxocyprinus asiaticus]